MANVLFAYNNYIDTATLGAGTWSGTYPLANAQSGLTKRVSHTANTTLAATMFTVTLPVSLSPVNIFGVLNHNLSIGAKFRLKGSDDSVIDWVTPIFDSGWQDVYAWGAVPQDDLEWEQDNFWFGNISQEDRATFASPLIYRLPATVNTRYWRMEFDDQSNADGFVSFGRAFVSGDLWTPAINYSWGARIGYEDKTLADAALGGADIFDVRERYRVMTVTLDYLTKTEAYQQVTEIQRLLGGSGDIAVIPDTSDTAYPTQRNFIGRLRSIQPIRENENWRYSVTFEIKELL